MELHWIETAPFQLTPAFTASIEKPLRVWKHNYMSVTSFFDLDYGKINPKNRNLDSFNHQVTAGWVAVSNGRLGLLIGEDAQTLSSMAFCPMGLREQHREQTVSLNPFGSYYGRHLDYSHLGGNGNGTVIMQAFSGALSPNGPSFNGETLRFSLLLAPYLGDEPPQQIQHAAAAHFYAPGCIVHAALPVIAAVTLRDIERFITSKNERAALQAATPIHPLSAFLANPSANAVDLVWDAPREEVVTGYKIQWRDHDGGWQSLEIDSANRFLFDGFEDGKPMKFRICSLRGDTASVLSDEVTCTPGAVTVSSVTSMLSRIPLITLTKVICLSLWSLLKAKFQK